MMMNYRAIDALQNAVNIADFERARHICNEQIASGSQILFWRTQMAYIHFLDEEDADRQYQSPILFQGIVVDFPADENALFWYGYSSYILTNNTFIKDKCFLHVLELNPDHLYTNIFYAREETDIQRSIRCLEHCLTNNRAVPEAFDLECVRKGQSWDKRRSMSADIVMNTQARLEEGRNS
jgi:hypothetical protein